jgi:hypothetical protein
MFLVPLAISSVAACIGAENTRDGGEELGEVAQPIINGATLGPTHPALQNAINVYDSFYGVGCSGVALDNQWVLTAQHCTYGMNYNGAIDQVARASNTSEIRKLAEVRRQPGGAETQHDLALLRVGRAFTDVPRMREWSNPLSRLIGSDLFCIGRGHNNLNKTGFGTWRYAWLRPIAARINDYDMGPNSLGQIQYLGDSGGPCISYSGSPPFVTGILGSTNGTTNSRLAGISPENSAWSRLIRERSELLFYNKNTGTGYISSLEATGTYASNRSISGLSTQWTHITSLRNGAILFYNKANGVAAIARLERDGTYSGGSASLVLPANARFMVAVGDDMVFFLDDAGVGRTARIDAATFTYTPGTTVSGFFTAFTHVVGTKQGGLFFFNRIAGTGATATIDANMNYVDRGYLHGFSTGWTYVTAVNERGLFFYNPANGTGYTAEINASGYYASHNPVSGIGPGYSVIGAFNGVLLFRNASGGGGTARVSDTGHYVPITSLSGFSTAWTHASLE